MSKKIMKLTVATVILILLNFSMVYAEGVTYLADRLSFGGNGSYPTDINNSGQIVGNAQADPSDRYAPYVYHAFLYDNGVVTDLGTLGGEESRAYGINDSGQIVGYAETASGQKHAFLYENGGMTDLGTLGMEESCASAISNSGRIIGYVASDVNESKNRWYKSFFYENATMTVFRDDEWQPDLAPPKYAINDSGNSIVVTYSTLSWCKYSALYRYSSYSNNYRHIRWIRGIEENHNTVAATGINDSEQIVGYSGIFSEGAPHAFLNENGVVTDLGTARGGYRSYAKAINNSGQIIGRYDVNGEYPYNFPFFYYNDEMTELDAPGWFDSQSRASANAINDSKQIAGTISGRSFIYEGCLSCPSQQDKRDEQIPAYQPQNFFSCHQNQCWQCTRTVGGWGTKCAEWVPYRP
ncbi:MAG: hypothetical protein GY749_16790 [Desulfobacteraceae bacterium]|nr:hypothetical protein [Desulfobacteraceae bacterium]